MAIAAERGETLDLLRRHIALLEREFHEMGFDDIRFSFASPDQRGDDPQSDTGQDGAPNAWPRNGESAQRQLNPNPRHVDAEGLDLRL